MGNEFGNIRVEASDVEPDAVLITITANGQSLTARLKPVPAMQFASALSNAYAQAFQAPQLIGDQTETDQQIPCSNGIAPNGFDRNPGDRQ